MRYFDIAPTFGALCDGARYVDDRLRSRVAGMRLTVAFGVSSLAVWMLGPLVKANGFAFLLGLLAAIAAVAAVAVTQLPRNR